MLQNIRYYIFTHTGNMTLPFYSVVIVKEDSCTCGQGQVLQRQVLQWQVRFSQGHAQVLQALEIIGHTCKHPRLLSQNNSEDVELPVRVENRRCSRGFKDTVAL